MNVNDPKQRDRLFRAMETSYRTLEPFRNLVYGLVSEYAGGGYGSYTHTRKETIVNLMNQAVDAYTMSLVANRPRVLLSTPHPQLEYFARQFQEAVNNLIKEIGLEMTLKQWVLDAFFCIGVVKVHMADSGQVALGQNMLSDPGIPFASNVSLDNWGYDIGAKNWYEVKYSYDSYRIPFEDLKGDIYDQAAIKDLLPTSKSNVDDERLERISKGYEVDQDEFEPMIDLVDVWVERDAKIYTFPLTERTYMRAKGSPVAVMDWDGPEFGPHKILGFNDVPEQIMPASPASHLSSLSRLANNLWRKQSKRARSARRFNTYSPADAEAVKNIDGKPDDAFLKVEPGSTVGQLAVGGVDPAAQAFLLDTMEMFDRMAGNLTAMMGLGAQADTVGQEQLIHSAVSKKEASMQYRVVDSSVKLIRDLGYMLWNDKFKTIKSSLPIEGAEGYTIDATWTPDDREGDFFDYNFDIDVYSMPYQSPAQRINGIVGMIAKVYGPLQAQMMQQGGMIDMQELTNICSDLMGEPRLKKIFKFTNAMPGTEPDVQGGLGQSTTRNYTRKNIPTGGTQASRNMVRRQGWLGQSSNPDQNASLQMPGA